MGRVRGVVGAVWGAGTSACGQLGPGEPNYEFLINSEFDEFVD